ncbi:hypothetical protein MEO40_20525 [Dolichospermum sp. ST_sed1]|nr:hypothetical protein [Dolichospermum sp. ST_sed1]
MKIQIIFFTLISCVASFTCAEKNYGTCKDSKPDITEMTTIEEKEAAETKKYAGNCTMLTYQEDAELLIKHASNTNSKETKSELYLAASKILTKLVEFSPEEYDRYGVLAACHAGVAGVELLSFVTTFSSSDNASIFESGKKNLPSPEDENYDLAKEHMERAAFWIDEKIRLQALTTLPKGDQLQAGIYRMAYTFIIANGFLSKKADGKWDMESLENMTPEDVDAIIGNLDTIASTLPPEQASQFEQYQNSNQMTDEQKKALIKQALEKNK